MDVTLVQVGDGVLKVFLDSVGRGLAFHSPASLEISKLKNSNMHCNKTLRPT